MLVMFQAVFFVAEPADRLDRLAAMARWRTRSTRIDARRARCGRCWSTGVIGGVGGVLVFLPQILILFFFIAVLEDCGYMARAAYLMDQLMSRRAERQIVHSAVVVVRLRHAGHHGDARDREPPRPADDDPGRPADELQRAAAGLYAVDRGVHAQPTLGSGRLDSVAARADDVRHVPGRHRGRRSWWRWCSSRRCCAGRRRRS